MNFGIDETPVFKPVSIAILIVSDTRTPATDTSGAILEDRIETAGHNVAARTIIPDDVEHIRKTVRAYINDPCIDVVISSGGTGLTGRDVTPEAVAPLFDKAIDGFSTIFHHISLQTVGLSTLQSRAIAGIAKSTIIFCLPGSNGAVKDGWDKILAPQLDSRYRPCNFVELLPRLTKARRHHNSDTP